MEFKENFDKIRDWKNISAIANIALLKGKDFWYIIYWVEDKTKKLVWTKFKPNKEKKWNQHIKIRLSQKITPKTYLEFYELTIDSMDFVIVEVSSAKDVPVKFDNISYIRIGESTAELSKYPDLERKIWNNERNKNFETWIAEQNLRIDEVLKLLDYDKYFQLTKQELPTETHKFLSMMESDSLVEKQLDDTYNITILWALLFARNVEDFPAIKRKFVRVITYDGDNKTKRKNDIDMTKWYWAWFEGLINYILSQIWNNEEITKSLRLDISIYPEVAIREFVANALIHQDCSFVGAWPEISIFDNRIEITNPGIPLIDTDRFIDNPPISRNERLVKMMRKLWFCEDSWSWVDRAIIEIELYQLPAPKFDVYDDFLKVTLYAPKELKNMSKDDKIRACYQHCVLLHVVWREKMTNTTLRKRFNIPESNYPAASKIITLAVNKGKIKEWEKSKEYIPWWA